MRVVIELSQHDYMYIREMSKIGIGEDCLLDNVFEAIRNGTPLPKGHGDLIDRDKLAYLKAIHDAKYGDISWSEAIKKIKYSAPTVIEADDKAESEE